MNVLLFLGVIVVLIVVHELGHFLAAKLFGIRVEEFGIGYPPRAITLGKIGETTYTLNWLPFGGFVKIFGEGLGEEVPDEEKARALVTQSRWKQAIVFIAGVAFNMIFAFLLFSLSFMLGAPNVLKVDDVPDQNSQLVISGVLPDSPAYTAGLKTGDTILSIVVDEDKLTNPNPKEVSDFIANHAGSEITISYKSYNKEERKTVTLIPAHGVIAGKQGTPAIGIEMVLVSSKPNSFSDAIVLGYKKTIKVTKLIFTGTINFVKQAVTGNANWQAVAGPVGMVKMVGDASAVGLVSLLNFMAMISINLAIINLLPIPALDGGRLLFVVIEGVIRRRLHQGAVGLLNIVGFAMIILLMIVITYHDIVKLFI